MVFFQPFINKIAINNFGGGTHKLCFPEFESKDKKKNGLHRRVCKKSVLAHNFWGDDQYFGGLRPRTALQWHRACYFLWGTILVWGVTSGDLGGTAQDCLPVALGLPGNLLKPLNHITRATSALVKAPSSQITVSVIQV